MPERVDHIAANEGVTEIRVHGVGGANPAAMLGRVDVHQATGDATAGFFRASSPAETGRTVEAYSWGGLTARSKSRAMWVLLLPFALVNLAGWMVEPIPVIEATGRSWPIRFVIWVAKQLENLQRFLVHVTALAITGAYVMWVALMSMNLLAYQCGSRQACTTGRFYADFLQNDFFVDRPGRRIVVGALVPLALLALFAVISLVSRSRYEGFTSEAPADETTPVLTSLMSNRGFWYTTQWHTRLFRVHIGWTLAFLGGITAYAAWQFVDNAPGLGATPSGVRGAAIALFFASIVLACAVLGYVWFSVRWEDEPYVRHARWLNNFSNWIWWAGVALTTTALLVAWQLRAGDEVLVRNAISSDLWGFGWTPVLLFGLAVLSVLIFSLVEVAKWTVTCQVSPGIFFVAIAGVMILAWPYAIVVLAITAFIAGFARYAELQLCDEPSPISEWVEVAVPTIGLLVVQQLGHRAWPDTIWGDDWPRLMPVLLSGAFLFHLFHREAGRLRAEAVAAGDTDLYRPWTPWFPALAVAVLIGVGGVLWYLLARPDPVYLGLYVAWLLVSFFWVAIQPHSRFRWNGPGAVALLAVSLTAGLFSGGLIRFVSMLTRDGYQLVSLELYSWLALGFVAISAAGLVAFLAWLVFSRATQGSLAYAGVEAALQATPDGLRPAPASIGRRVKNWVGLARGVEALDVFIMHISMATLFCSVALVVHFIREGVPLREYVDTPLGESWNGLTGVAAWVALMIVLGAVLAVRSGLRDEGFRRQIGIIWDVTSFWPRHFHPFAPPPYAVRTVPELQERIGEVHDRAGATILSGHSQGSVVAFAAAASLDETIARRTVLVTHGSPLRRFYARFFPKYFGEELIEATAAKVGPTSSCNDAGWINFYRMTDPVAQRIFVEPPTTAPTPPDAVAAALGGRIETLPDVPLDDPYTLIWQPRQRPPEVLWHLNYMSDPRMSDTIETLTEILGGTDTA